MSQEVIEITEREIEVIEVVEKGPAGPVGPQANINYTVVSSPQTLSNSQNIAADTSGGAFTLTLPANPNAGDSIDIFDYSETFDTNPLTIARNGQRIESLEENLICNVEGAYFTMIYTGATRGWQILPRYGTSGGGGETVLTTQGDTLYRGVGVNARLPIGTANQFLRVNSSATAPEWDTITASDVGAAASSHTHTLSQITDAGTAAGVDANQDLETTDSPSFVGASITGLGGDGDHLVFTSDSGSLNKAFGLTSEEQASLRAGIAAASIDSPALTGTPTAPTATAGTNTTQIATTAFTLANRGDRYLTTSTSSHSITTGSKTFTVQSGLSYTATQDITIVYDGGPTNKHMHGVVTSYSGTTLVVDVQTVEGSGGPFTAWTINVGGLLSSEGALYSANNLSDVANTATALTNLGGVPTSRTVSAGTGLSGGGDLTANRTLSVAFGNSAGTAAEGNHTHDIITSASGINKFKLGLGGDSPTGRFVGVTTAGDPLVGIFSYEDTTTYDPNDEVGSSQYGMTVGANDFNAFIQYLQAGEVVAAYDFPLTSGTVALTSDIPSVPSASSATPQALGTAAAGTNADFSRADHVHAMPSASDVGAAASGSITTSGLTQATARILGRTDASSGPVQEITIGSGLSLSAGELSATGSGISAVGASTADVLSVSGSDLVADDPNADRIVFWDDSESKLRYLEAGSGLSISGTTMTVTATGGATNLWIPASAWIPRTTSGCGVDSREIGATNRQNVDELLFDTGSEEFAQALVVMPSNYNNSTLTARFYWTASSGSGGVAWGISGRAFGDDDAIDQATGTRIVVTDTLLASNDVHVTSATSAVTIDGTPAANKAINFQISRVVADAADTLAVDARFLGAEIIFN